MVYCAIAGVITGAMTKNAILAVLWLFTAMLGFVGVPVAHACGGFFCGRPPADQTAERIVFKVNPDSTSTAARTADARP